MFFIQIFLTLNSCSWDVFPSTYSVFHLKPVLQLFSRLISCRKRAPVFRLRRPAFSLLPILEHMVSWKSQGLWKLVFFSVKWRHLILIISLQMLKFCDFMILQRGAFLFNFKPHWQNQRTLKESLKFSLKLFSMLRPAA